MLFSKKVRLDLKRANGKIFFYRPSLLEENKRDLENFLSDESELKTIEFAKRVLFSNEIQATNQIEGYKDSLDDIDSTIKNDGNNTSPEKRTRILNAYRANRYILTHQSMDKESLRELYRITSDNALCEEDRSNMGSYYRKGGVYILHSGDLNVRTGFGMSLDEGVPADRIDEFMEQYFNFLYSFETSCQTDEFIKSQILHLYFVYIHPYYDVNGRTSRAMAMWYLLNKKAYQYIIFNRGIAFKKTQYSETIQKAKMSLDMTYFIDFMLKTVREELEKEYVLKIATSMTNATLEVTDYQALLLFLSMKGEKSARDFARFYNYHNPHRDSKEIYDEMLTPLLDKGLLDASSNSQNTSGIENKTLKLRPIEVDPSKIRNLQL